MTKLPTLSTEENEVTNEGSPIIITNQNRLLSNLIHESDPSRNIYFAEIHLEMIVPPNQLIAYSNHVFLNSSLGDMTVRVHTTEAGAMIVAAPNGLLLGDCMSERSYFTSDTE